MDAPVFYVNGLRFNLSPDVLYLELLDLIPDLGAGRSVPGAGPERMRMAQEIIASAQPVAKIRMEFTTVVELHKFLAVEIPRLLEARRAGLPVAEAPKP